MKRLPSIDLHPQRIPSAGGADEALMACRTFLEAQWKKGFQEVEVITGLGLHGDGTPRLRQRVEREVLPVFADRLESVSLRQGGAVLFLRFTKRTVADPRHLRHLEHEARRRQGWEREERLAVARQRFQQARESLKEDDDRRARLKINQLLREFEPLTPELKGTEPGELRLALDRLEAVLRGLDAL